MANNKFQLPGNVRYRSSGGTSTYTGDDYAYWIMAVGNASATVTVTNDGASDNYSSLVIANGQGIPCKSKSITVNDGAVIIVLEE